MSYSTRTVKEIAVQLCNQKLKEPPKGGLKNVSQGEATRPEKHCVLVKIKKEWEINNSNFFPGGDILELEKKGFWFFIWPLLCVCAVSAISKVSRHSFCIHKKKHCLFFF